MDGAVQAAGKTLNLKHFTRFAHKFGERDGLGHPFLRLYPFRWDNFQPAPDLSRSLVSNFALIASVCSME